jgi:hypothetical protein
MARLDPASDLSEVQEIEVSPFLDLPTGDSRLPNDVWPDIVSHLSYESVENVMFVCRYFRTLAQPSFFRMLAVKPFNVDPFGRSSRNDDDTSWIRQKLQFYSSPTIARQVQFCRISPHRLSEPDSTSQNDDEDCGRAIIDAVFELLPQLTNLMGVELDLMHLADDNMKQMSCILHLNTLLLRNCTTTVTTPIRLAVQTVLLNRRGALAPLGEDDPSKLLSSLLHPNVECLCIMGDAVGPMFFYIKRTPPLHFLRSVCIHHSALVSFLPCLSQLPALLEIILHTHDVSFFVYPGPSSLPPFAIPLLESYEGPLCQAGCFGQGRPIRHLRFWGMNAAHIILNQLHALESGADLESLEFYVNDINESLLVALFDKHLGFPKLKALDIKFDHMDPKVSFYYMPSGYV